MLEPLPEVVRPERPAPPYRRELSDDAAIGWLKAGLADLRADPVSSIAYGLGLTLLSYATLWGLYASNLIYLALPAISGFLIIGPFLAVGLYEKSRRRVEGRGMGLLEMITFRPVSAAQLAYAGLLMGLLILFWLRAADLLYALFFGLTPFPGAGDALSNVFTTFRGWMLILTGTGVGGLFAAFAFALSAFSVPLLVFGKTDALTAMGTSFAITTQNLRPMLTWGAIVTVGLGISAVTGLLGLIVVFPVLGHGTWHAYRAVWPDQEG